MQIKTIQTAQKNVEKDFNWYLKKAKEGDARAQNEVGKYYYEGKNGAEKNFEEAFKWWMEAAKQDFAEAQINVGICFDYGEGVEEDKKEAFKWYMKAADQENDIAQLNIGMCYYLGEGVEEDKKEAFEWYMKAAEQGNDVAQLKVGKCYSKGEGVEENKKEAFKWYRQAAKQGNNIAQRLVGWAYSKGYGVKENNKLAFIWYRRSAKQGNARAQLKVGICYYEGIGVEKNMEEALQWLKKAAEQGNKEAESIIKEHYNSGNVNNQKAAQQDNTKIQNEIDLYENITRCVREAAHGVFNEIKKEKEDDTNIKTKENQDFSKVFIVHGRDELKHKIARLLQDQNIEAIILDEQPNGGAETIIKKFEENSNVCAAICLFTADDIGKLQDKYSEKEKTQNDYRPRARQNVVFETGFFMAKLGRKNVIIIADPEIEFPSDMGNILYTNSGEWRIDMLSELDNMGYGIDLNKLKKRKLCKN